MPTLPTKAALASPHLGERRYFGRSVVLSVGIHLLFAALVGLLAVWLDIATLELSKSSSIAQCGPAPDRAMTVKLVMTDPQRPTPTPVPKSAPKPGLPVLPLIQPISTPRLVTIVPPPRMATPRPAPAPVETALTKTKVSTPTPALVKTTPKPNDKPRPKYTASHSTGQGNAPDISSRQLTKLGYPAPNYPPEAKALDETGTVLMEVGFGPDGRVTSAQVRQSSGFSILDMSTRSFIRVHWKDLGRANTTIEVPIIYALE